MTETITILHNNPHVFINEFADAVKDKFYVQNTNSGWVSEANGRKSITLYKNPDQVFQELPLGEFVISEYDTQTFLYKLCERIACGAVVDNDSLWWDVVGIKSIKGKMFLKGRYNKAELAELDWETFKASVKTIGITGRDRNLMLTKYLQNTGQEV